MRCRAIGLAGVALLMAAMWGLATSQAQDEEPRDPPVVDPLTRGVEPYEPAPTMRREIVPTATMPGGADSGLVPTPTRPVTTFVESPGRVHLVPRSDEMNAIRNAAARLRDVEGEARADAERHLHGLLQEYFDSDLRQREEQLAQAAAQLDKLRELLERRRQKKAEIIELQIKVLENEAEGLGFFNPLPQPAYRPQPAPPQPYLALPQSGYRPPSTPPQPALQTPPVLPDPGPWPPQPRDPQRDRRQRAEERLGLE